MEQNSAGIGQDLGQSDGPWLSVTVSSERLADAAHAQGKTPLEVWAAAEQKLSGRLAELSVPPKPVPLFNRVAVALIVVLLGGFLLLAGSEQVAMETDRIYFALISLILLLVLVSLLAPKAWSELIGSFFELTFALLAVGFGLLVSSLDRDLTNGNFGVFLVLSVLAMSIAIYALVRTIRLRVKMVERNQEIEALRHEHFVLCAAKPVGELPLMTIEDEEAS